MARRKISEELWSILEPLLPVFVPSRKSGRRRSIDDRPVLNGILYVLQTGVPWEDLPQALGYGSGMTCWRRLRDWQEAGGMGAIASGHADPVARTRSDRLAPGVYRWSERVQPPGARKQGTIQRTAASSAASAILS